MAKLKRDDLYSLEDYAEMRDEFRKKVMAHKKNRRLELGNNVCLHFEDEHNTGIYSWEYLYNIGQNQEALWKEYLDELGKAGHQRKAMDS